MVGNGKEHPNGIGPAELEGSTDLGFLSAALVDGAKEAGLGGGLGGYAIDDAVDNFTALGRIESYEGGWCLRSCLAGTDANHRQREDCEKSRPSEHNDGDLS
jgi:hypothetical protein